MHGAACLQVLPAPARLLPMVLGPVLGPCGVNRPRALEKPAAGSGAHAASRARRRRLLQRCVCWGKRQWELLLGGGQEGSAAGGADVSHQRSPYSQGACGSDGCGPRLLMAADVDSTLVTQQLTLAPQPAPLVRPPPLFSLSLWSGSYTVTCVRVASSRASTAHPPALLPLHRRHG